MTIAETVLTAEQLEEEIRRDNDRRYTFYRMLRATDRLLWRLEELNVAGIKRIPSDMRSRMKGSLAELPSFCMEAFRDSDSVQEVLDGIFAVQDALFALYVPGYECEAGEDDELAAEAPANLDKRILAVAAKMPGVTHTEIVRKFNDSLRGLVQQRLPELVAEGVLRAEGLPPAPGPGATRYWLREAS